MPQWHNLVLRSPGKAISERISQFKSGLRRNLFRYVNFHTYMVEFGTDRFCDTYGVGGRNPTIIGIGSDKVEAISDAKSKLEKYADEHHFYFAANSLILPIRNGALVYAYASARLY